MNRSLACETNCMDERRLEDARLVQGNARGSLNDGALDLLGDTFGSLEREREGEISCRITRVISLLSLTPCEAIGMMLYRGCIMARGGECVAIGMMVAVSCAMGIAQAGIANDLQCRWISF